MAGKIKKLLDNELVGGTQTIDVYPVTSIKAVYDEDNERLDHIFNRRGVVNISTNYNDDHIAEVLTLKEAINKVPSKDRVLGFQGRVLTKDGWVTYQFTGNSISEWGDIDNWDSLANQSYIDKIEPIVLSDFTSQAGNSGKVHVSGVGDCYYNPYLKKVLRVTEFNSVSDYKIQYITPLKNSLYTFEGVIYKWNGTDLVIADSEITGINYVGYNRTIELKNYLITGTYSNSGAVLPNYANTMACLIRMPAFSRFKISFDNTKYIASVKYLKGADVKNGLEYVSVKGGVISNVDYTVGDSNYMSISFSNEDNDWSSLNPTIEITIPEQVLNESISKQSDRIDGTNANIESYKNSMKSISNANNEVILMGGSNISNGFITDSGDFIPSSKSAACIINNPKFITVENYTTLAYQIKAFFIVDGVIQKKTVSSVGTYRGNFKGYDWIAIHFYKNLEDIDTSKLLKITNSQYPHGYDPSKVVLSSIGMNPGNLVKGVGYGWNTNPTIKIHHGLVGSNPLRACTLVPMLPGKLVLSNHIINMNVYDVLEAVENKGIDDALDVNSLYNYAVSVNNKTQREYDAQKNQTTFILKSNRPIIATFANADNTNEEIDFEVISYTPAPYGSETNYTYNIPINVYDFGDATGTYNSFAEPIMVTAPNGTIMVGGMCGKGDAYQNTFNSFSTDKGKTWTHKWTEGHRTLTYDRVNNKLYSLDRSSLYVSSDYGMTWELKKSLSLNKSSDMIEKYNSLREEEKKYFASHPEAQRYAYSHSISSSPNPGVQLSNGVICFQKRELIKKYGASKDEEGNWIVDSSGYPTLKDTSFANTVDIIESVAFIVYSKDYGETWETSPHTPLGVMMDELTIAEAKPNQICINGRGGTEAAWNDEKVYRHIFFQVTPVDDRESFSIDNWEADYETRTTNTIEDSIVNASFAKIAGFTIPGANKEIQPFWLFCNVYNPSGFDRHSQLLRLSPDCHNWFKVKLLTPNEEIVGGYSSIASTSDGIYIIIEGNRAKHPMKFINLTTECLTDILGVLSSVKEYYN